MISSRIAFGAALLGLLVTATPGTAQQVMVPDQLAQDEAERTVLPAMDALGEQIAALRQRPDLRPEDITVVEVGGILDQPTLESVHRAAKRHRHHLSDLRAVIDNRPAVTARLRAYGASLDQVMALRVSPGGAVTLYVRP